ncbi:outer membrane autotransporter [Trichodelitschia bisporula]|uniref:Outer membrane autotransporter n=1 Tax=Trichodelitschia bisporula TaxID=703511 RepID=A0A6G1I8Y2_9PEZI|nr:outer membrane autotransporter [Trichodelitschia bisporula]
MPSFVHVVAVVAAFSVSFSNAVPTQPNETVSKPAFETTCGGKNYVYDGLAGYGFVPPSNVDKYGDTIGGFGSSIAISGWKKSGKSYKGTLYGLPDRGWNTNGSINFIPRVHKFALTFTPNPAASISKPGSPNIDLKYQDTILLKGPDGTPATGLDADVGGALKYPGFPDLPVATYTGDGFGGAGPGGKAIPIDSEGIVLTSDGGFWISDEYGPYVYKFDASGKMTKAIRPPNAILPLRNGTVSFNANTAPRSDPKRKTIPANPTQGRQNNQGFEGLTTAPKGETLYVLLQSAAFQEGGANASTRFNTRFLKYSIKDSKKDPELQAEYVVQLPIFKDASNATKVAAQSEVHYISDTQFLILARDSGNGHGQSGSKSLYRHADIFDITKATNIKGTYDAFNQSIASINGALKTGITPATYCSFLDFNLNSELNKFGVHNGGAQDAGLLNEKWEGLALLPVIGEDKQGKRDGKGKDKEDGDEYYLFSLSDNDFITQNGKIDGGKISYADASGFSLDNQALVFKVTIPKGSKPLKS